MTKPTTASAHNKDLTGRVEPVTNQAWMIREWDAGRASFVHWGYSDSVTPERGGYYLIAVGYENDETPGYVEISFWDADRRAWNAEVGAGRRLYAWAELPSPPTKW